MIEKMANLWLICKKSLFKAICGILVVVVGWPLDVVGRGGGCWWLAARCRHWLVVVAVGRGWPLVVVGCWWCGWTLVVVAGGCCWWLAAFVVVAGGWPPVVVVVGWGCGWPLVVVVGCGGGLVVVAGGWPLVVVVSGGFGRSLLLLLVVRH